LTKKKIFITIDWFDPAYKAGGPVVSIIKLIENLYDQFDFFILTGSQDYGDTEEIDGLITNQWLDWKGMAKVYYLSKDKRSRASVFAILDESAADVYYIQGVFSRYFSIYPLIWWHQAKQEKAIVATRGMFHTSALQVKRFKKLLFLYLARIMGWYHHVYFHSTNPEETAQLKKILGREATYIEASNFPRLLAFNEHKNKTDRVLKILNVARISPEKNTLFLLDSLQHVIGEVTVTIVGNYADSGYFQQFLRKRDSLPPNVKVNYIGHKPIHELPEFYATHDIFVMPTTGENFGHAIIEALSAGLPCLISKNTPWNGLEESSAGFNLDFDSEKYSEMIDFYFNMTQKEYHQASLSARQYAEDRVNIEKTKEAYIKLLA
jgi:glycosyltransferase involved in cell wall biosynthesis